MSLHPSTAFQTVPSTTSLQQLTTDLSTAVDQAIRHRPCSRVVVLALHWANDDLGVEVLESQLLNVFRQIYNFEVSTYVIPIVGTELQLANTLDRWFTNNQGEGVLRIAVYSGHARVAGTTATRWLLA